MPQLQTLTLDTPREFKSNTGKLRIRYAQLAVATYVISDTLIACVKVTNPRVKDGSLRSLSSVQTIDGCRKRMNTVEQVFIWLEFNLIHAREEERKPLTNRKETRAALMFIAESFIEHRLITNREGIAKNYPELSRHLRIAAMQI